MAKRATNENTGEKQIEILRERQESVNGRGGSYCCLCHGVNSNEVGAGFVK